MGVLESYDARFFELAYLAGLFSQRLCSVALWTVTDESEAYKDGEGYQFLFSCSFGTYGRMAKQKKVFRREQKSRKAVAGQ